MLPSEVYNQNKKIGIAGVCAWTIVMVSVVAYFYLDQRKRAAGKQITI